MDRQGNVNYQQFLSDSVQLNQYLNLLEKNPPSASWTRNQLLAYWINAYNAYTIQLILHHYPIESIKDIGSVIQIPFVNSPWDIKFITIGTNTYDLNNIEHDILRDELFDPRIHFAIVCASKSCPVLHNEAFEAEKLEQQLNMQAKRFINDPIRNKITTDKIKISKIFSWFQGDFTKQGSLIEFLNQYSNTKIDEDAEVEYMEYDWRLNE